MNDRNRSCLGFVFLSASLVLAAAALIGGWIGWDFRTGAILSVSTFVLFAVLAAYMFVTIKDYAWFPAVVGGLYAVLPDLMAGPGDDVAVLALGAVISGIWSWRRSRRGDLPAEIEIIEKKKEAA
jgi:hypothetical protein